jgi:hypothetical protein
MKAVSCSPFKSALTSLSRPYSRTLALAITLTPFFYLIFIFCINPRPYYIHLLGEDLQHNFYYNALLLHSGYSISAIDSFHPGTPIYYLSSWLYSLSNSSFDSTQRFFNIAYIMVAFLTSVSLLIFARLTLSEVSFSASLFIFATLLSWPPIMTYIDHYGSTSFVMPLALVSTALFWTMLDPGRHPTRSKHLFLGAILGFALAVKLSFTPLVIAILVASFSNLLITAPKGHRSFPLLLCAPLSTISSFVFFNMPIFTRLPSLFVSTFLRSNVRPQGSDYFASFYTSFISLMDSSPSFLAAFLITVIILLISLRRTHATTCSTQKPPLFDFVSAFIFVGLLFAGFVYTMACAYGPPAADQRFRNVTPTIMFLPYLQLLALKLINRSVIVTKRFKLYCGLSIGFVSLLMILFSVHNQFHRRQLSIDNRAATIERTKAVLEGSASPGSRIAIYDDEDSGGYLGEVSFHLYGNHNYGDGVFDEALLKRFPKYAYFRLREVDTIFKTENSYPSIAKDSVDPAPKQTKSKLYIMMRDLYFSWLSHFPQRTRKKSNELVDGEQFGLRISIIAFPTDNLDRLGETSVSDLLKLIENHFGPCRATLKSLEGVQWCIIFISQTHQ